MSLVADLVEVDPRLTRYLRKSGWKDVLTFESNEAALEAARVLRVRGLTAEARYEKVLITMEPVQGEPEFVARPRTRKS